MIAAGDEQKTHHFRGKWFGFGPISNDEFLVFAIFEKTKRNGQRLSIGSFERKKLVDATQSIARQTFVTRATFRREVAERGEASKGKFIGISTIRVENVREIISEAWPLSSPRLIRGFGALDLVEEGDFDGHGTIGFLAEAVVPKARELGPLREFLIADLAEKFSEIMPLREGHWGSILSIATGRISTIWRSSTV